MNKETKQLTETAVKAIQDKKGKGIKIVDLSNLRDADGEPVESSICQSFIICEGNSPSQVDAICDNVEEMLRKELGEKPVHLVGKENSYWIAMDYVDLIVHIFVPEARDFYNLENLWADAPVEEIEDLD